MVMFFLRTIVSSSGKNIARCTKRNHAYRVFHVGRALQRIKQVFFWLKEQRVNVEFEK